MEKIYIFLVFKVKTKWVNFQKCRHYKAALLTCGADGEDGKGQADSQHASVLGAEPLQAELDQLAQRLRQTQQVLLQLRHKGRKHFNVCHYLHKVIIFQDYVRYSICSNHTKYNQ